MKIYTNIFFKFVAVLVVSVTVSGCACEKVAQPVKEARLGKFHYTSEGLLRDRAIAFRDTKRS